jgi:hypothetical protein
MREMEIDGCVKMRGVLGFQTCKHDGRVRSGRVGYPPLFKNYTRGPTRSARVEFILTRTR